jgi:hypothetical protein
MAFFCIVGALLCLPPANTSAAWSYAAYYQPQILSPTMIIVARR